MQTAVSAMATNLLTAKNTGGFIIGELDGVGLHLQPLFFSLNAIDLVNCFEQNSISASISIHGFQRWLLNFVLWQVF
jgi:hypothetical protein